MQEELRRSNAIGDIVGVHRFTDIVLKEEIKKESARQICLLANEAKISFDVSVAFFEYLGYLTMPTKNLIRPTGDGATLVAFDREKRLIEISKRCISRLIEVNDIDSSLVSFDSVKNRFYFRRQAFPLYTAVFRNFLIMSRALISRPDGGLEITELYEQPFLEVKKKINKTITLEILKKQLAVQEAQGETAELFVVTYEKKRLGLSADDSRIKRISIVDVTAGYDIVSFEESAETGYNRFIEVKSYKGGLHFYWSQNEISKAKLLADKYYLYLVSIDNVNEKGYEPLIIKNPAKEIVSEHWIMSPNSYSIVQATSKNKSVNNFGPEFC